MQVIGAPQNSESLLVPVLSASAGVLFFCMLDAVMKAQALAMGAYSATFWRAAMGAVFASALYLPYPIDPNSQQVEYLDSILLAVCLRHS